MWGQELCFTNLCNGLRIIPTRVGTSKIVLEENYAEEDHPHACGDKFLLRFLILRQPGSSPRVWGQATIGLEDIKNGGIIPTRVGTRDLQALS